MNENNGGNAKVIIGIVAIIVIAALVYYFGGMKKQNVENEVQVPAENEPVLSETLNQDSTAEINQVIDNIDLGNLDADLKDIDTQLENL